MMPGIPDGNGTSLVEWILRALLFLYPPSFREDFKEEWIAAALHRKASFETGGGRLPRLSFVLFLMKDLSVSLPREWASAVTWRDGSGSSVGLWQDLRFALRSLRRRPLFTALAVVTLGLGIGTTSAMFSVVDGVLLRPLPFEDPASLVAVWEAKPELREGPGASATGALWDRVPFTFREYREVKRNSTRYSDLAVFAGWGSMPLTGSGVPEQLSVGLASANLFSLLGVRPVLGRVFLPGEDGSAPGEASQVGLLSYELWQRRFGGDPSILGRTLTLNASPFTVVGVLPAGFRLPSSVLTHFIDGETDLGLRDIWVPIGQVGMDLDGQGNAFDVVARMEPGATLEQARWETEASLATLSTGVPPEARVAPFKEVVTGGFRSRLLLLLGSSGLLLLIACVNIATLLTCEATGRREEIATRAALGAGFKRISRQLLTESAFLGLMGGVIGAGLGYLALHLLMGAAPVIPRMEEVGMNLRVLSLALGVATLTGALFGLAPLALLKTDAVGASVGTRRSGRSRGARRLQGGMVAAQVALTTTLLISGGLLTRSLLAAGNAPLGFEPQGLATLEVNGPSGQEATINEVEELFGTVIRELEESPGVLSVAGAQGLPFPGGAPINGFQIPGTGPEGTVTARRRTVWPGYFSTMGIPLVAGRAFTMDDDRVGPKAMIVSESLARRFWPQTSPVGESVLFRNDDSWRIVGVVGDVRHSDLTVEEEPTFYIPVSTSRRRTMDLVIRTAGDPGGILPSLQDVVWSVNPDLPITRASTMRDLIVHSTVDARFRTLIVTVFSLMAMIMAGVGIFGVTARAVAHRTHELGIRISLGAKKERLVVMVLRGALGLGFMGTVMGLFLAFGASDLITHFLFGVGGRDPLTFSLAGLLLLAVCMVAALVPALRVARIPPAEVLRGE